MRISKNFSPATAPGLAALLVAVPILAQGQEAPVRQDSKPESKSDVRIVGHDVVVGAAVTNGGEADKQKTLGSISDLVLDGKSGKIVHAVVAHGGTLGVGKTKTSVAWDALSWDAKNARFTLAMTPEALAKLPEFNPEQLLAGGGGAAADTKATDAKGEKTKQADAGAAGAGKTATTDAAAQGKHGATTYMLVSKIGSCDVMCGSDKVGSTGTLFIEPASGASAFVSVSAGGVLGIGDTTYVIPWNALKLATPIGKDQVQMHLAKAKKDLEAAPKLGDAGADLSQPEFRNKVYEFYGVGRPEFEGKYKGTLQPKEAKKEGKDETKKEGK